MAMTTCKESKTHIYTIAESWSQYDVKEKKIYNCAIIVAAFLGMILLSATALGYTGSSSASNATSPTPPKSTPNESTKTEPATAFTESKEIIEEVEARLKSNSEHLKKYYGTPSQVKQATADLVKLAVIKGLYEKSGKKEEKNLGARATALILRVSQQQRTIYASATEEIFVRSGMDVRVTANGAKKDQLNLKYVLMSKPLVYKFQNEVKLSDQARVLGFKKIIYSDGYDTSWTVDL